MKLYFYNKYFLRHARYFIIHILYPLSYIEVAFFNNDSKILENATKNTPRVIGEKLNVVSIFANIKLLVICYVFPI